MLILKLFVSVSDLLERLGSPVPVDKVVQMAGIIEENLINLGTNSESQETKKMSMLESLRCILADARQIPCGKLEESTEMSETGSEFGSSSMDNRTSGGDKSDLSQSSSQDDIADCFHIGPRPSATRRCLWPEPDLDEHQSSVITSAGATKHQHQSHTLHLKSCSGGGFPSSSAVMANGTLGEVDKLQSRVSEKTEEEEEHEKD